MQQQSFYHHYHQSDTHKLFLSLLHLLSLLQSPGFALIIDRRAGSWQDIQKVFTKIVGVFPGKIKEVFLLYRYPDGQLGGGLFSK